MHMFLDWCYGFIECKLIGLEGFLTSTTVPMINGFISRIFLACGALL